MMNTFCEELRTLINRRNKENGSNTPDYVLAEFLEAALGAFDAGVRARDVHQVGRVRHAIAGSDDSAQAEVTKLREAVGFMATLKPGMVMRPDDPVGMAREVVDHIQFVKDVAREDRSKVLHLQAEELNHRRAVDALADLTKSLGGRLRHAEATLRKVAGCVSCWAQDNATEQNKEKTQ